MKFNAYSLHICYAYAMRKVRLASRWSNSTVFASAPTLNIDVESLRIASSLRGRRLQQTAETEETERLSESRDVQRASGLTKTN